MSRSEFYCKEIKLIIGGNGRVSLRKKWPYLSDWVVKVLSRPGHVENLVGFLKVKFIVPALYVEPNPMIKFHIETQSIMNRQPNKY